MATSNDKHRQFHHALVQSPEYLGLARKDRKACSDFVDLAITLDGKSPPSPEEIEMAYVAALGEARKLVAKGLLTVELPDQKPKGSSKSDAKESTAPTSHRKYEFHPTASIFPMMSDEALNELAADIKAYGLRDPIVMHEGRVIDGRNRLEACHRAGVEPTFTEWDGSGSVVSWIISVNVHRRHLNDQQRAMIAARVVQELATEATGRSARNLRNSGDPVDGTNLTHRGEGRSTEQAASLLNVSASAAKKATKIAKSATEELVKAVSSGTVSLDAAAQVAALPKAKQREVVAKGEVRAAAKKIREDKAASKGTPKKAPATEPHSEAEEPQSEAPAPNDEVKPTTDKEPPVAASEEEADDEEAREDTSHFDPDDVPLLRDTHRAIDDMVHAGRCAQKMDKVAVLLSKLIEFSTGYKTKFEEISMS